MIFCLQNLEKLLFQKEKKLEDVLKKLSMDFVSIFKKLVESEEKALNTWCR